MAEVLAGDSGGVAATVLDSGHPSVAAGATLVLGSGHPSVAAGTAPEARGENVVAFGVPDEYRESLIHAARAADEEKQSGTRILDLGGHDVKVLTARLLPPPRLLILGAGLDALPVLRLAVELGWRVTVQDHRPAYIERGDFSAAERVSCVPADRVADELPLDRYDAVIVMSHHLATDRKYLTLLARTRISYIGLLGPPDRRSRLMEDLGENAARLEYRLHGPAGFDIGADGPASIALSILAEVHAELRTKARSEQRVSATTRG
jgi:xanthine/CO dehydrogenase XdhC/CoxF family maturation factor